MGITMIDGAKRRYVSVKQIEAWPEVRDGEFGYGILYPDGYQSWSPKQVFEDSSTEIAGPRWNTGMLQAGLRTLLANIASVIQDTLNLAPDRQNAAAGGDLEAGRGDGRDCAQPRPTSEPEVLTAEEHRAHALHIAAESCGPGASADEVLERARIFEAYIDPRR